MSSSFAKIDNSIPSNTKFLRLMVAKIYIIVLEELQKHCGSLHVTGKRGMKRFENPLNEQKKHW